jgi:hypothetical protein
VLRPTFLEAGDPVAVIATLESTRRDVGVSATATTSASAQAQARTCTTSSAAVVSTVATRTSIRHRVTSAAIATG